MELYMIYEKNTHAVHACVELGLRQIPNLDAVLSAVRAETCAMSGAVVSKEGFT